MAAYISALHYRNKESYAKFPDRIRVQKTLPYSKVKNLQANYPGHTVLSLFRIVYFLCYLHPTRKILKLFWATVIFANSNIDQMKQRVSRCRLTGRIFFLNARSPFKRKAQSGIVRNDDRFRLTKNNLLGVDVFLNCTSASNPLTQQSVFSSIAPGYRFGLRILMSKNDRTNIYAFRFIPYFWSINQTS